MRIAQAAQASVGLPEIKRLTGMPRDSTELIDQRLRFVALERYQPAGRSQNPLENLDTCLR
jgi:hypothetical protein